MFTVEVCIRHGGSLPIYILRRKQQGSLQYNLTVLFILFITLLFGNFAEAIAEARGKAVGWKSP